MSSVSSLAFGKARSPAPSSFVHQKNICGDTRRHHERQPCSHAGRVMDDRLVQPISKFRFPIYFFQNSGHIFRWGSQKPRQQPGVLVPRQFRLQRRPEAQQRNNSAFTDHRACVGDKIPAKTRQRVDLPLPFRPTTPTRSPSWNWRLMFCNAQCHRSSGLFHLRRRTDTSFAANIIGEPQAHEAGIESNAARAPIPSRPPSGLPCSTKCPMAPSRCPTRRSCRRPEESTNG